jgi:sugar lactone lactonase YvrE
LAAAIASALVVATALASAGHLTGKGCIADTAHNPDACAPTTLGLEGADGVAVSADGKSVYAVANTSNAIVRFKRNRATGALTPKGCIADPANNPDGCAKTAKGIDYPDAVVISPDGKSVYVGAYEANAVVSLKRNRKTGGLTPAGCIAEKGENPDGCPRTTPGLYNVESLAISPDGRALYAGGDVSTFVRFKRSRANGALAPKGCVGDKSDNYEKCKQTAEGIRGDVSLAVSPDSKSVYAGSNTSNAIATFKRSRKAGALHQKGPCIADATGNPDGCTETTANMAYVISIAVSSDGRSVYVAAYNSSALVRFKRDKTTGALTPAGCYSGAGCTHVVGGLQRVQSVAVSPDSKSVYTASHNSNAVVGFARNRHTGALTTKQCVADAVSNPDGCVETALGLTGADSVAVSPDGKSVYTAAQGDNAVVRFDRAP